MFSRLRDLIGSQEAKDIRWLQCTSAGWITVVTSNHLSWTLSGDKVMGTYHLKSLEIGICVSLNALMLYKICSSTSWNWCSSVVVHGKGVFSMSTTWQHLRKVMFQLCVPVDKNLSIEDLAICMDVNSHWFKGSRKKNQTLKYRLWNGEPALQWCKMQNNI